MRSLCTFQLPRIVWRAAVVQGSHVTLPLFVPTVVGHAPCILCVFYDSDGEPSLSGGQRKGLRACVTQEAGKYSAVLMARMSTVNSWTVRTGYLSLPLAWENKEKTDCYLSATYEFAHSLFRIKKKKKIKTSSKSSHVFFTLHLCYLFI